MSLGTLAYRLRVRTRKDDADLFVVTSLRTSDVLNRIYNYIAAPPTGDGLQIDPLTGQVTVGAYTIDVIDQCADILQPADEGGFPAAPPAPGNLVIGDMLLGGSYSLVRDVGQTIISPTYPPVSPESYAAWPGPNGFEVWGAFAGSIGGGGAYFFQRASFGPPAFALLPSTSYVARVLGYTTFGGGGIGSYGFRMTPGGATAQPHGTYGTGPFVWSDIPVVSDGAGSVTIDVGALDMEISNADIVIVSKIMLFDTTGTPPGGGEPGGPGTSGEQTGHNRLVTSYLADLTARQQLLGLKAYLEESTDGGVTWI
jgi:hypothetical protein